MGAGMEDLNLARTQSSPEVRGCVAEGRLLFSGESYPENSLAFYRPIQAWVSRYLAECAGPLRLEIRMTYLNTSSIKCMMDLLDALEAAHGQGREVALAWYYDPENDRALELAEEFKEDYTLPFDLVPIRQEG